MEQSSEGDALVKQFNLFNLFIQEIAHTIRTPLSVVFSELQFIEATKDCENIPKALNRSEEIIKLLKDVSGLFSEQKENTPYDVLNFIKEKRKDFDVQSGAENTPFSSIDRDGLLNFIGLMISQLAPEYDLSAVKVSLEADSRVLFQVSSKTSPVPQAFASYRAMVEVLSGLTKMKGIAVDLFFLSHMIRFRAEAFEDRLIIELKFP